MAVGDIADCQNVKIHGLDGNDNIGSAVRTAGNKTAHLRCVRDRGCWCSVHDLHLRIAVDGIDIGRNKRRKKSGKGNEISEKCGPRAKDYLMRWRDKTHRIKRVRSIGGPPFVTRLFETRAPVEVANTRRIGMVGAGGDAAAKRWRTVGGDPREQGAAAQVHVGPLQLYEAEVGDLQGATVKNVSRHDTQQRTA